MRTGFFEPEQYLSVIAHLPAHRRPVITFAYVTGWRIPSEVLRLEWRQIDFAAGEVRLNPGETKNREGRVFPFTPELRSLLEAQREMTLKLVPTRGSSRESFIVSGGASRSFRSHGETPASQLGALAAFLTTSDARRSVISSEPASQSALR